MQFTKTIIGRIDLTAAVVANLLMLLVLGCAAALEFTSPVDYYRSVQEDGLLEWASFWAFALAGGVAFWGAVAQRRSTGKLPWFLAGVGLFCLVVAMEEISWGQRVLGYRPPPYFLAENYQQELNFHNVLRTDLRKLGLTVVIVGFGMVLPLLTLWPFCKRWFDRLGIVAPPLYLAPAFLATAILYVVYPWSHTGEWVEMMLGLGFLFGVAIPVSGYAPEAGGRWRSATSWCLIGWAATLLLGAGAALMTADSTPDPRYLAAAREELAALQVDMSHPGMRSRCGTHRRLFTLANKHRLLFMMRGEFMRLRGRGSTAERARFFLDPWDSPYWYRHDCKSRPRKIIVYSFGPNRRRDSTRTDVLGDDLAVIIRPRR